MKHGLSRRFSPWLLLGLALPLSAAFLPSPGEASTGQEKPNRYIGASKCKNCHSSEESGDQYGKWTSAAHSKAYDLLATPEAMEAAKAAGVADPQKAEACLKCHVTAHGAPEEAIKKGFKIEQGVQCESCHGPGEQHMSGRMKAAMSGEATEGYSAPPEGEILTEPGFDTCVKCHNPESPTFKQFCFFEMRDKISHENPLKPRTQADRDAKLVCGCGMHDDPEHTYCGPDTGCGVPAGSK